MKAKEFSFRRRAVSFRFAWIGARRFFRDEHNARIHLTASTVVAVASWVLGVSARELIVLVIVTGFVWAAEIFNTAIENIMDFIAPAYHPRVKLIKDLSAAAVLVAAATALATALFIFIPKIV